MFTTNDLKTSKIEEFDKIKESILLKLNSLNINTKNLYVELELINHRLIKISKKYSFENFDKVKPVSDFYKEIVECIQLIPIKEISKEEYKNMCDFFQSKIEVSQMTSDVKKLIRTKNNWIMSSILYTSYNLILSIPVLISLRKQISKELNIKYIAFFSSIIINILAILIFMLMAEWNLIDLEKQEMPAIYIVRNKFFEFRNMYAFIILASIFTTAISVGIGFLQNISKNKKSYTQYVIIMCITSLFITKIGFSKVMNFIYPVFGYFGIMQIVLILTRKLKNDIAK